jgi:hypothetical protein
MIKTINFSLFGTEMKYYMGAEKNVIINKELLPDWTTVIYYHPQNIIQGYVEKLSSLGATMVDVSNIKLGDKESIHFPYFWRFLSFLQDSPSIVRDLDSRISEREVKYIRKWEETNKDYFIIRDHPWHAPVPSGLFGIKKKIEEFEKHFIEFVNIDELRWGSDQEILRIYMENISDENVFYCGYDIQTNYIHRDDKTFFIGMQMNENDEPTVPSGVQCLNYLNEINL